VKRRNFEFQIWQIFDEGSTPIVNPIEGEASDEKVPEEGRSKFHTFNSIQYLATFHGRVT
jgi:hypothetical protein